MALSVEGLSTAKKLKDVSFEARAGEVLGFFGLMGAGRTELAKAIVGYDPITQRHHHHRRRAGWLRTTPGPASASASAFSPRTARPRG